MQLQIQQPAHLDVIGLLVGEVVTAQVFAVKVAQALHWIRHWISHDGVSCISCRGLVLRHFFLGTRDYSPFFGDFFFGSSPASRCFMTSTSSLSRASSWVV